MPVCRACLAEAPAGVERCPSCGAAFLASSVLSFHVGDDEDADDDGAVEPPATPSASDSSRSSTDARGWSPSGALVGGRYRVLGVLGSGGMGEVFRAEDKRLGVQVALKFLPDEAAHDEALRARLAQEVRTARAVTHPNVCRVHDLGEHEGHVYLSMELVDGEDLGSLLKRIGRLSGDKATELARQICAGLAAAHARGILHRDLKPANVMVDGEGRARITDFGLATLGEAKGHAARAGTPLYMAPEQLAGREATVKSDVYALGLVLHELFTGRRPHRGTTTQELLRERTGDNALHESSHLRDVPSEVEDLITRCLDPSPRGRPASALAVAAALPGADSLEARLAAGETPSPELVAAAGGVGALTARSAAALSTAVVLLGVLIAWMNGRTMLIALAAPPFEPAVLAHQAREMLATLGFEDEPVDEAFGLNRNGYYLQHLGATSDAPDRWDPLRTVDMPSSVVFWYRRADGFLDPLDQDGVVTFHDPPRVEAGMVTVELSSRGRLLRLESVPSRWYDGARADERVDWAPLLSAAGLIFDPDAPDFGFEPGEPDLLPSTFFDEIHRWETRHPDTPELPLFVEAAGFQGTPVRFALRWETESAPPSERQVKAQTIGALVSELVEMSVFLGGLVLAWRGWRSGRADRRGAIRILGLMLALAVAAWAANAHVAPDFGFVFGSLFSACVEGLAAAAVGAALYVALEGFIRRVWPRCLVAWSRLLGGGWRDPLVGREVLVGALIGLGVCVLMRGTRLLLPLLGEPPPMPESCRWETLLGTSAVVGDILVSTSTGLFVGFGIVLALVLLRLVVRLRWLAIGALAALCFFTGPILVTELLWLNLAQRAALTALLLIVVVRHGMLAIAVATLWLRIALTHPATLDFGAWYGSVGIAFLALIAATAIFGFRVSSPAWLRAAERSG